MTTRALIRFFVHYKYIAIFPIAVLEGPIITIISGFLASRHILSFFPAFLVVFSGDAISDSIFYWIGHRGRSFIQKFKFLRVTDERINKMEAQYARSPWKTMIVAKVSYGLGTVFMISAGLSHMSLRRFFESVFVLNALRSLALISIGYYFGRIALRLGPEYLENYTIAVVLIVPLIYLLTKMIKKRKAKEKSML
jgi:membrane protein DedA with SNARE-associated domain